MSRLSMRIAEPVLCDVFRLPQTVEITGATMAEGVLTLTMKVPDAPEGAVTIEPLYHRASSWPDPLVLTDIIWRDADGREIKP